MIKNKYNVYSFYRFLQIKDKTKIKYLLDQYFSEKNIKGTILLAHEGINGSIAGSKKDIEITIKIIKKLLKIRKLDLKINEVDFLPFNRIKVRLKKEIVSLGKGNINVQKLKGDLIEPSEWNLILEDKNTEVIDVRNSFEIKIGKFKHAVNPNTDSFREFPKMIKKMKLKKNKRIAMYCTGGIRCEKASSFLKMEGYKNVVQLSGGILNYLEYTKNENSNSLWNGECFVFDNRVAVNKCLKKGRYIQCYGCRRPITKKETKSELYVKGVSCPYCFYERSDSQKKNSLMRQNQIEKELK